MPALTSQAEPLFASLLEAAPDAVIVADASGEMVLVNEQTEALFGYTRKELLGQKIEMLIPKKLGKQHTKYRQEYAKNPYARPMGWANVELRGQRSDGSDFPVEISLNHVKVDGELMVTAIVRDISARKHADEERRTLNGKNAVLATVKEAQDRLVGLETLAREYPSRNGQRTLQDLARDISPKIADWCIVDLVDGPGSIRLAAVAPENANLCAALISARTLNGGPPKPTCEAANVVRTGKACLYPLPDGADQDHQGTPLVLPHVKPHSAMIIPMIAHGRTVGAITLAVGETRAPFTETDLRIAEVLAGRVVGMVAGRQQDGSAGIASVSASPTIPGVDVATLFCPKVVGSDENNDFYDMQQAGADSWAVLVGGAAGRCIGATAPSALARSLLTDNHNGKRNPAQALADVNEAVRGRGTSTAFCALSYAKLELSSQNKRVTVANAGSPLPLLITKNGEVKELGEEGAPLGALESPYFVNRTAGLEAGDHLVFYTDGVIKTSGNNGSGHVKLVELLKVCAGLSSEQIAERIENVMLGPGAEPSDDISVVVFSIEK